MRLVHKANAQVTFTPTGVEALTPVHVEIEGDDFIVSSKPGISFSSETLCFMGNNNAITFQGVTSIFINGVPHVINGPSIAHTKETDINMEDDKYKKLWNMDMPVFDEVQLTGSGTATMDPKVLSKVALKLDLTGSGDIELASFAKFDRATVELVGSGDIDLCDSEVKDAHVNLTGSGDIKHFIVIREGNLKIAGSGDIKCRKGPGAKISERCYGSGDIKIR